MNPNFKKYLRYGAMALFIFALVANISVTSTNPFMFSSELVLAQTSSAASSSSGSSSSSSTAGSSSSSSSSSWTDVVVDVVVECAEGFVRGVDNVCRKVGTTLNIFGIEESWTDGETTLTDPCNGDPQMCWF